MIKLSKPNLNICDVYGICCDTIANHVDKAKYLSGRDEVIQATAHYDAVCSLQNFHLVPSVSPMKCGLSHQQMTWLYDMRLTRSTGGRAIYDKIMAGASARLCSYCRLSFVKTLDHYLPKSAYPALAVSPINLIPVCSDCNTTKSNTVSSNKSGFTLHPYYDDFSSIHWLHAIVIHGTHNTVFKYVVSLSCGLSVIDIGRLSSHMSAFNLYEYFTLKAAEEFLQFDRATIKPLNGCSKTAIRSYIIDHARVSESDARNSWKCAMYYALSVAEWYIDMVAGRPSVSYGID